MIKVDLYAPCYNEMHILPFVVDYWKRIPIHHAYIFDSASTDGTVEFLRQFDWVTVIDVSKKVNNEFNEASNMNVKNNEWKEHRDECDFIICCDIDEVLYMENPEKALQWLIDNKISLVNPPTHTMISEEDPEYADNGLLYHEEFLQEITGKPKTHAAVDYDKCLMFDPKSIKEINYTPGGHDCHPVGNVIRYSSKDVPEECKISTIHIKYPGLNYILKKYKSNAARMSSFNKRNRYGWEYLQNEQTIRNDFNKNLNWSTELKL